MRLKESIILQNVFGIIGTVFWTIQIIPQVWKSWREKSTEGLSYWLLWDIIVSSFVYAPLIHGIRVLWNISNSLYGVYAIAEKFNIPLLIQPETYAFLITTSLCQCMYYGKKWPLWKVWAFGILVLAIIGGFQAGFAFAIRPSLRKGKNSPALVFGALNAFFIFSGFIPQYIVIIRFGEVKGISLIFMFIDMLGGVFSLLSILFQRPFNIVTIVAYTIVIVFDSGILVCAFILNPIAERRRQRETDLESKMVREGGSRTLFEESKSQVVAFEQKNAHETPEGKVAEGIEAPIPPKTGGKTSIKLNEELERDSMDYSGSRSSTDESYITAPMMVNGGHDTNEGPELGTQPKLSKTDVSEMPKAEERAVVSGV